MTPRELLVFLTEDMDLPHEDIKELESKLSVINRLIKVSRKLALIT